MALVAGGIANRGVIITPHVMSQIRDSQGNLVRRYQPKPWLTATSPLTAAAVTTLMQGVVTIGHRHTAVFPASWDVAAKTGTAETGASARPLDQRLDDRLRPGQRPQGGRGRGRAQPAGQRHRCRLSGPPIARPSWATPWRTTTHEPDRVPPTADPANQNDEPRTRANAGLGFDPHGPEPDATASSPSATNSPI